MYAAITDITYFFPDATLTNTQLAEQYPDWPVEKIEKKTGIQSRRVVDKGECASDLAFEAARKMLKSHDPKSIDYLLFCTQSPDYPLPTTACILQDRLGLLTSIGALDFNLGCSGYVYGLSLAKGLVESSLAQRVLLLTADTYSRFLGPNDRSVRTIFGDAGTATLIESRTNPNGGDSSIIGPFVFGTDGTGAENLILRAGANRPQPLECSQYLHMNGAEIFSFTLKAVPESVSALLERSEKHLEDIDLFVFHQANQFILDHLRRRLGISSEKFFIALKNCGNTVSSSIPVALVEARNAGRLAHGDVVMLVGFGVGYSWSACLVHWV